MTRQRLVYVCSAARCGSTVLDMFLGSHPQVASLGEINLVGKAMRLGQACTCGAPLTACPAWAAVWELLRERTGCDMTQDPYALRLWDARARVLVDRAHQTPAFERRVRMRAGYLTARARLPEPVGRWLPLPPTLAGALANKQRLYDAVADAWATPVVVDSSKNPWEAIEQARIDPERTLVILLVRDGRGVFHSRRSSGFSREESLSGWRGYYGRTAPVLRKALPAGALLELRYEDFAAEPERVGRELCNRLGIPFSASMPRLEAASRHMVNGNDTRFQPQRGVHLDERWPQQLATDERHWFEHRAGALNRSLGYR